MFNVCVHNYIHVSLFNSIINSIRSREGEGNIAPPDFWQALQLILEEPVTLTLSPVGSKISRIFSFCVHPLYSLTSKIVIWNLTGLTWGVLNRPVKIFCAYFGHIHIFYNVLFHFYHVRCLNILKFGHRLNFDQCVIFAQYFDHIWLAILYRARSCASQCALDPNVWMMSTKIYNKPYIFDIISS